MTWWIRFVSAMPHSLVHVSRDWLLERSKYLGYLRAEKNECLVTVKGKVKGGSRYSRTEETLLGV